MKLFQPEFSGMKSQQCVKEFCETRTANASGMCEQCSKFTKDWHEANRLLLNGELLEAWSVFCNECVRWSLIPSQTPNTEPFECPDCGSDDIVYNQVEPTDPRGE